MTKYEDLRPCAYDAYSNEGEDGRERYRTFVETICGKFHQFSLDINDGTSCNYAIIELEDGSIENIPAKAGIRAPDRNFRFTDHNEPEEDNDNGQN